MRRVGARSLCVGEKRNGGFRHRNQAAARILRQGAQQRLYARRGQTGNCSIDRRPRERRQRQQGDLEVGAILSLSGSKVIFHGHRERLDAGVFRKLR